MIDDFDVKEIFNACNVDIEVLKKELTVFLKENLKDLVNSDSEEVKPTLGFQRVIQRAVIHVQSSGKEEATAANVLVSIFSERESHAVYYLQKQNLSRLDVVEYLSHGNNEGETEDFSYVKDQSDENDKSKSKEFLDLYCTNLNIKAKQLKIDPVIGLSLIHI